ncbi:MAG: Crp/Fnr family transcriptional regulator [Acetobacteraceae bacterium]|nr:Crp/Fnr family transcriptional regulator [Pseudomonadota bacterium]
MRGQMDRAAAERALRAKGWLSEQPAAIQADLLRHARLQHLAPGDYAYQIEDPPGGIYGVAKGGFAISVTADISGPHLAHIARSGTWFGDSSVLTGRPRRVSAQAVEASVALYVPLDPLEHLIQSNAAVARALGSLSSTRFRILAGVVSDLLIRRADRRIAATLLRVTGVLEGERPDDPAGFRLTQSELGEMANASRHLVNRTLGRFEASGWVACSYNRIAIRKPKALAAFVRDGD